MAAARKALASGAHMWELDVAMSADGELVVMHDRTLTRTSNARDRFPERSPWWLHEFTIEELRRLDCGSWFLDGDPFGQLRAGNISPEDARSFVGEPVPTLREALLFTRQHGWSVNVEIKDLQATFGHDRVVTAVLQMVEALGMSDRVLLSSFNHDYLEEAKRLSPAIRTGVLVGEPVPNPLELLGRLRADAYHPRVSSIDLADVALFHEHGYRVNIWVANEPASMEQLIRAGADGIFTDYPQVLHQVLA
jgi:glycerophosphoryl diester phosphodiesterase